MRIPPWSLVPALIYLPYQFEPTNRFWAWLLREVSHKRWWSCRYDPCVPRLGHAPLYSTVYKLIVIVPRSPSRLVRSSLQRKFHLVSRYSTRSLLQHPNPSSHDRRAMGRSAVPHPHLSSCSTSPGTYRRTISPDCCAVPPLAVLRIRSRVHPGLAAVAYVPSWRCFDHLACERCRFWYIMLHDHVHSAARVAHLIASMLESCTGELFARGEAWEENLAYHYPLGRHFAYVPHTRLVCTSDQGRASILGSSLPLGGLRTMPSLVLSYTPFPCLALPCLTYTPRTTILRYDILVHITVVSRCIMTIDRWELKKIQPRQSPNP